MRPVIISTLLFVSCSPSSESDEQPIAAQTRALSSPLKVVDLNSTDVTRNVTFQLPAAVDGGLVFFGPEPHFTDGSGGRPLFLLDLEPGAQTPFSGGPTNAIVSHGGSAFFRGPLATLWRTDGTLAGTRPALNVTTAAFSGPRASSPVGLLLRQSSPSGVGFTSRFVDESTQPEVFFTNRSNSLEPSELTPVSGGMIFLAEDDTSSRPHVFFTDGTDAGTRSLTAGRVSEVLPGFVPARGRFFFRTASPDELWSTDGTTAGTEPTPIDVDDATSLFPFDGGVVWSNRQFSSSDQLMFSDGTDAGTRTIVTGTGSGVHQIHAVTSTHVFSTRSGTSSTPALWASDGTDAGTLELNPSITVTSFTVLGNRFVFNRIGQLWSSDGTVAGTTRLSTTVTITTPSFAVLRNGLALFRGDSAAEGQEAWVTDGTMAGTRILADMNPGGMDSIPTNQNFFSDGERVWWSCSLPSLGTQVCVSDGTPAGTRVATSSAPNYSPSSIRSVTKVKDRLLLVRPDNKLFVSDGTQAGTAQLPIGTGLGSTPRATLDGQSAYFTTLTNNGPNGAMRLELVRTDGTDAGTVLLGPSVNLNVGNTTDTTNNDSFFYLTYVQDAGDVIISYRPDAGFGTIPDTTPRPGVMSAISQLTGLNDRLVWIGSVADAGPMMLSSTGDDSAPLELASAPPSFSQGIAVYAGFAWASVGLSGAVIKSDGTVAGTSTVDLGVIPRSRLFASSGGLYFAAVPQGGMGLSIFRSDGTAAGTVPLAPIGNFLNGFKPWGDGAIFVSIEAITGAYVVWATDGTSAGTRRIQGLAPERLLGSAAPVLDNVLGVPGAGAFIGHWTREGGLEPASLEPGANTVTPLIDLFPGPASSEVSSPVLLGNTLYFVADDGEGDALFAVDAMGAPPVGGGSGGGSGGSGGGTAAGGGNGGNGGGSSTGGGNGSGGGGDGTTPMGCGCQSVTELGFALALLLIRRRAR